MESSSGNQAEQDWVAIGRKLRDQARWFGLSTEDAEEAAQTVLARYFENRTHVSSLDGWMYTVLRHECQRIAQHQRRLGERKMDAQRLFDSGAGRRTQSGEILVVQVVAGLQGLGLRDRLALIYRYWEELPAGEIAARLGISPTSVKNTVSRALAKLRVRLRAVEVRKT
jgi:RNA polymerase sigma factor (sigma-70 family)